MRCHRWGRYDGAPPETPTLSPTILDATLYGRDCWQIIDPVINPLADIQSMSEDCLYLNILTPSDFYPFLSANHNNHEQQKTVIFVMEL